MTWYKDIRRVCGRIPIAVVGNKADLKQRGIAAKHMLIQRRLGLPYFSVSAKANYHIEQPFLWLIRELRQDPELILLESPMLRSAEAKMETDQLI